MLLNPGFRYVISVDDRKNESQTKLAKNWLFALYVMFDTVASQSGIEPGTSCTAGEHSMQ
jgi:hypothetical protein